MHVSSCPSSLKWRNEGVGWQEWGVITAKIVWRGIRHLPTLGEGDKIALRLGRRTYAAVPLSKRCSPQKFPSQKCNRFRGWHIGVWGIDAPNSEQTRAYNVQHYSKDKESVFIVVATLFISMLYAGGLRASWASGTCFLIMKWMISYVGLRVWARSNMHVVSPTAPAAACRLQVLHVVTLGLS